MTAGPSEAPALEAAGLAKAFGGGRTLLLRRRRAVHAVQSVSVAVAPGETLGIVGESGCGKSTLARMLVGLLKPDAGRIAFGGRDVTARAGGAPAAFGRAIQYVFQDPTASLNPRKSVADILAAPLVHLHGLKRAEREPRIAAMLDAVGLPREALGRYPHEVSGGQAQRIGIARALLAEPRILLLDEPVSALDVSIQAQVLNLLSDLKMRFGLTYIFISHDLAVVETVADRVAVMYFGRIVEKGPPDRLFARPLHPYTDLLARSAPVIGRPLAPAGVSPDLPDPSHPPPGCAFRPRCPRASARCAAERPALAEHSPGRLAACHHPLAAA